MIYVLIYDISYKTLTDPKPSRIRFNKIDGFIRICDGTTYLKLFDSEKCEAIYNRISQNKSRSYNLIS